MSEPTPPAGDGGSQNPFAGFDPKSINAESIKKAPPQVLMMGGGAIAFVIFAFFDWWSVNAGFFSNSINAFDNFRGTLAWICMLGVLAVAVLLVAKGPNAMFTQVGAGLSAVATLFTLWFWGWLPDAPDGAIQMKGVDVGASFGLFVCLIAAIVSTAGAVMLLVGGKAKSQP